MPWMMLFIAVCLAASASASWAETCRACHRIQTSGIHGGMSCSSCHGETGAASTDAAICSRCHGGYERIFSHSMATRADEKAFVARTVGKEDPHFFDKNCGTCHVKGCRDCHGSGHGLTRPGLAQCLSCHRGYYTGAEYVGMAPREDSLRYQRGEVAYGQQFLKMLPDIHAERGLTCGDCHSMQSLIRGERGGKRCTDCHKPSRKVLEHRIPAHLDKMECYACHSAWGAQEYGTFFIRFKGKDESRADFRLVTHSADYVKSAYLRKQDAPPLGINNAGRVSPIRPEFILYLTVLNDGKPVGEENRLLSAEWRAFFPHTIRRGSVMCDGCHNNPRRFVFEPKESRIYQIEKDGMGLESFWDRKGQTVVNGSFMSEERYRRMNEASPAYQRDYVQKWQKLIEGVEK